ncbi:crocetin glucosyltransferase, chloroplastic-like [Pistacia vera]|uniref:crocetin glucosyltransferase, chloroplastic-like n=1 Tax=Pistacia vera TaxID=55513 RepID=UPI001262E596|nr:crocetin glucosyltransferase, chloroplastic-like [Pistacia vera]
MQKAVPCLPSLNSCDIPSFLLPSDKYPHALESFQEQMEALHEESNPKILVNTFDALESEALIAIDKFNMITVGPLIPYVFLGGKDPSDTSFGVDLFRGSNDYIEWLNSKPKSSVVYVSFGSLIVLEKQQMEEIARGLLSSAHPFLWVIRENQNEEEDGKDPSDILIASFFHLAPLVSSKKRHLAQV